MNSFVGQNYDCEQEPVERTISQFCELLLSSNRL